MLSSMLRNLSANAVPVLGRVLSNPTRLQLTAYAHSKAPEFVPKDNNNDINSSPEDEAKRVVSPRVAEFRKKLRETTPINDLGEQSMEHPSQEKEPLPSWPDGRNPHTGELGGPRGPEPTRYGDWERKGRVTDF